MPIRHDGRANDQLRPVKITRRFTKAAAGSVLWEQGETVVWCTAAITPEIPPWFREDRPGGWITAEYVMLPASTPTRKAWPKTGHTDSRGTEIQRLIGRCLRAVIDLTKIGPHTIAVDCQVLQADGGTRTAAISAAYVALVDALQSLPEKLPEFHKRFTTDVAHYSPKEALVDQLAAVSTGIVDGEVRLDLDYHDDSRADVDMNIACTAAGKFVEIQGSAEGAKGFDRSHMLAMIDLATAGCRQLMQVQNSALGR